MIAKSLIVSSLIISSSFSLGLDDIVNLALENSYDLKKMDKNIQITNEDIKLSDKWKNPTLTIGANDIQFDEPFARDNEPMQANYIAISQIIPINNKLTYQKNIAIEDKKIAQMDIENKKLKLASLIYEYGYKILINKEKLSLLNKYQKNTQELQSIGTSLYENGKVAQIVPLKAQLLNSKIQIQIENIKYNLKISKLKLEEITYSENLNFDETLELKNIHLLSENIDSHPVIKSINFKNKKFSNLAKLEMAKKYSDIKVNLGYFQRDEKYKDYLNLSFSIPLPIYGSEDINVAIARYKIAQTNDDKQIIKRNFQKNFSMVKADMKKSFVNYKNLSSSMLPQRKFIQENIQAHYGLGHMKSVDLLSNINETISLELLALDELAKYYSAYAKSKYYTGVN